MKVHSPNLKPLAHHYRIMMMMLASLLLLGAASVIIISESTLSDFRNRLALVNGNTDEAPSSNTSSQDAVVQNHKNVEVVRFDDPVNQHPVPPSNNSSTPESARARYISTVVVPDSAKTDSSILTQLKPVLSNGLNKVLDRLELQYVYREASLEERQQAYEKFYNGPQLALFSDTSFSEDLQLYVKDWIRESDTVVLGETELTYQQYRNINTPHRASFGFGDVVHYLNHFVTDHTGKRLIYIYRGRIYTFPESFDSNGQPLFKIINTRSLIEVKDQHNMVCFKFQLIGNRVLIRGVFSDEPFTDRKYIFGPKGYEVIQSGDDLNKIMAAYDKVNTPI